MRKHLQIASLLIAATSLVGCNEDTSNKAIQARKAAEAAEAVVFTENAEIDSIQRRLKLTANPGLLGFIVLLNETGQPVMYAGVKGKITSGGKRLTATDRSTSEGQGTNNVVRASPSDEGTYGSSGEYIFFWTQTGQYVQWNGKYLYSDKPFRLSTEPLVVAVEQAK